MRHHQRTSQHARELRNGMTDAELKLCALQRVNMGCKFRRQVAMGPYVVDFACLDRSLIIEVDGGQHSDSSGDRERDTFLQVQGFTVLRFWNHDLLENLDGVLESIRLVLEK